MTTSPFESAVQSLAAEFARAVVRALGSMTLDEIAAVRASAGGTPVALAAPAARAPSKPAKRAPVRRSAEDLDAAVKAIVGALRGAKGGLSSEQIQKALASKAIRKRGSKRATRYYAMK
jgi:AcrR family transcriptional regulator